MITDQLDIYEKCSVYLKAALLTGLVALRTVLMDIGMNESLKSIQLAQHS